MGSHTDPDPAKHNPDNSCFCLKEEGFSCFKSGVFNMEPCKRTPELPLGAPIALSYPHFYEADQSFLDAVVGLKPVKEDHQFYVDVLPEFGFPLAIRPRFQLNAIIRKDEDIDVMRLDAEKSMLLLYFVYFQQFCG
jgi:scavenger receptor class B protein 1